MRVRIPRLNIPMLQPADLIKHLGKGEKHWKVARSAHALCTSWWEANGFPPPVRMILQTNPALADLKLVDGFFERQVDLGDGRRPSQTDLMAVCADARSLVLMAVEGKVDETFGQHVNEWRDGAPTREARLKGLCKLLGIDTEEGGPLRYQLLHRTASALIEAARYKTHRAIMLVHSFCPKASGFDDFSKFAATIGIANVPMDLMVGPFQLAGRELCLGWVADNLPANTISYTDRIQQ